MRSLSIVCIVALLAGCALFDPGHSLKAAVGHPVSEYLDENGSPSRTSTVGGFTYYTWSDTAPNGTTCERTLKADSTGNVVSWSWKGWC